MTQSERDSSLPEPSKAVAQRKLTEISTVSKGLGTRSGCGPEEAGAIRGDESTVVPGP